MSLQPPDDKVGLPGTLRGTASATSVALELRKRLPLDDWLVVGSQISRLSSSSAWWLGDWLLYGERAYRRRYRDAVERSGLEYQTLRNYAWVARAFSVSRRRDRLSFQHHLEVAALSEAQQDLWLNRAERLRWSRNELRRQLAASRAPRDEVASPVLVRLEVAPERQQCWCKAAEGAGQSLSDWIAGVADQAAGRGVEERPPGASSEAAQRDRCNLGGPPAS